MKPLTGQITPLVQRQPIEEEPLMTKSISSRTPQARDDLHRRLTQGKGRGKSLPETARSSMERRFGADFSGVRVHTGSEAVQMNRELNAQAFTHGRDIYFGAGIYSPGTSSGKRLLAHELTHVVQQNSRLTKQNCSESIVQCSNGARRRAQRFTAEGVSVVVRPSCSPAVFGFATVEAATHAALNAIFNTDCIEESRRGRIQRNLTSHGLDIRCRRTTAWCAESTGFFIPANIFTLGTLAGCEPLESTILHEIVHLTRGVEPEALPASCEASCFGVAGASPDLCRDIDVFGRRRAP